MGNYGSKKPVVREETEVDISYKKLSTLPPEFAQLLVQFINLHTLNASNNELATVVGIKRLTFLKYLNLEHNNIKEFEDELFQLVELQVLNLSHNQITHIPEEIRILRNLKELRCDHNKITSVSSEISLIHSIFCKNHLSHLTVLSLAHNQLDIFPIEISLLSHLKHLDLRANRIPSIPASGLAQCTKLSVLNLSHNALRDLPARLLDNLPCLIKLYISHNQLKQAPNVDKLPALKEVDVSYNKLERVPQFKQKLTFIDVSSNPATAGASKPVVKEKTPFDEPINLTAEPVKGKRLFHITGHSYTRAIIYMVDPESRLPDMGYYMLDNTTSLLLWEAHRCSPATKEVAASIAAAYASEVNIRDISSFDSSYPGTFWQQVGVANPFAKVRAPLPSKKDYYLDYVMTLKLFCIGEDTRGNTHTDLQAGKRPYHSQLYSDYCYVLDCGWDVFVWAGSESSAKQRQHALLKADELMDYPRTKLAAIQWEFEGEEKVLFKEQFLNWDESEFQVDIPSEPASPAEKAISSMKKRHDALVKSPDVEFGTFPEIKIVQKVKKDAKRPRSVAAVKKTPERPPTPEKAKLVPSLPINLAQQDKQRSLLSFAERPSIPKGTRAPSTKNSIRDRKTRHMAHEKLSPRNQDKSPRSFLGDDWKKVQLKSTGVALFGAEEGRNNADTSNGPRLIQFQGKRGFLGKRLKPVGASITLGGAYLLDTGKHGKFASRTSRGAALALAKALKDKERPDSLVVNIEANGDDTDFWAVLGGKVNSPPLPIDEADEITNRDHICLYKVRNGSDGFTLTTEATGSIKRELLESHGCYILDADSEIYIWYGKQSTKVDKEAALKFAEEIEKEKTNWCAPISKEFETSEQVLFREKFIDWGGAIPISMQQVPVGINVAPARKQIKIDIKTLHALKHVKEEPMVDEGKGKIKIWRVEDYEKVDISPTEYGNFYMGDAYIILYTYIWKNVERYIIYFYQGRDATITDAGAAALLTVGLDDSLNRQAKEVRVVQGKEPKHFQTIFKGKTILHQGQDPLGEGRKYEGPALYDIRGNDDLNLKAIQVFPSANMLHHCHVFILLSNRYEKAGPNFVWQGKKSNPFELNFALTLLSSQGYTNVQTIEQGKEDDVFWDLIGGESIFYDKNPEKRLQPRLFQCSEASGIVTVDEVLNFFQDDLASEDVFILDAFSEMYVWAGKLSTEGERKAAMELSMEYLSTATDDRPKKSTSYFLREGDETMQFSVHFQGFQWAPRHRMASMPLPDPSLYPPVLKPLRLVPELLSAFNKNYSYSDLVEKKFPKGLDASRLESYLSDEEFLEIFTVTKPEFEAFPLWKKEAVKKELNLF